MAPFGSSIFEKVGFSCEARTSERPPVCGVGGTRNAAYVQLPARNRVERRRFRLSKVPRTTYTALCVTPLRRLGSQPAPPGLADSFSADRCPVRACERVC